MCGKWIALLGLLGLAAQAGVAEEAPPIVYTVRVPAPGTHTAEVEILLPTGGRPAVELMMAVWTPGFYRVEDYAEGVKALTARSVDGARLTVEAPRKNRWRIETGGRPVIVVAYRLLCDQRSVTTNWIGDDLAVLNGAAAFPTPVGQAHSPHEIRIELPAQWKRSITALPPAPDGLANHYLAADFDTLADSPIVAGNPAVHEFTVDDSVHVLVDLGASGSWNGDKAANELAKMVRATRRFWGFLPFRRYLFLNVFRPGGGGLEHRDSTLLTAQAPADNGQPTLRWLAFVTHEYFHAFNVKRLRPAELGPFDYEQPAKTPSLWVSEGLTTYYGQLLVVRAGLADGSSFLAWLSGEIDKLQTSPGRRKQTLEAASLDVWNSHLSGVDQTTPTTVSYYVKGPIVGFLLDAEIQRATQGRKCLDDVMRLAYSRFAGEHGFTPEQFRGLVEELAGPGLRDWLQRALASTEELDYDKALDWLGLRFVPAKEASKAWTLAARADASEEQRQHLRDLFTGE